MPWKSRSCVEFEEALLQWEVEQQAFDDRLREQGVALQRRWQAARQTVSGLTSQIERLTIRAPFDGIVEGVEDGVSAGTWLPRGERLFDVVGPSGVRGDAYVGEDDVTRVENGEPVTFVASPLRRPHSCRAAARYTAAGPFAGHVPGTRRRMRRIGEARTANSGDGEDRLFA